MIGSAAKDAAAAKRKHAPVNPIVFIFMDPSRPDCYFCQYVFMLSIKAVIVICVYDDAGHVIKSHDHNRDFKDW
jgi:hypothetical protein